MVKQSKSPAGMGGSLNIPKSQGQGQFSSPSGAKKSTPDPVTKHPINLNPRPWPAASRKT